MLWSTGLGAARPAPRRGPCRTAHHSGDLPGQRRRPPADDLPIRSSEDPGSAAPGPRSGQPRRRRQIARGLGPVGTLHRSSLSEPADGPARRVAATVRPTQTLASRPMWRVTARPARRVTARPARRVTARPTWRVTSLPTRRVTTRRVTTRRVTSLPKTARAARTIAAEAVGHPDSLNVQLLEDRGAGPPAPGTRAPRGSDPAYQADPRGPAPWLPVRPDPPGRVELRSNAPDDLAGRDARDARDDRDARDGRDAGAARNARDDRGAGAAGDSQDGGRAPKTPTAQEPSDALDHVPHSAAPAALVQHHRRRLLPYRAWATSRWAASGGSLRRPCQHLRGAETDYCPASACRHRP